MLAMVVKVGNTDVNAEAMTKARPRLTEIVDAARDRGIATALTEYERPRAIVVSVQYFERAERDAEMVRMLAEHHTELFEQLANEMPDITVPRKMTPAD
jgi:PHD/YefM family antitoxin component YafN of YafNO toxin-antitoxin module